MSTIAKNELQHYRGVQSKCDHADMTEKHGELRMCSCSKLMHVTAQNHNITNQDFSEQYAHYATSLIDWDEVNRLVRVATQNKE